MIKRNDFKKVIKIMSFWKIDKRQGNYMLPSGRFLRDHLHDFIGDFLRKNSLAIASDGNIYDILSDSKTIFVPFGDDEKWTEEEQYTRIGVLVRELLY